MKGNLKTSFKTPITILISLVVLTLIIFLSLKLLSNSNNDLFPDVENEIAIYVVDGDTFETSLGESIRLLCVDSPEINQNGYEEAKNYLSSLILSENIIIEREGFDSYNRTLAWVSVYNRDESILVNKAIVDNGYGSLFLYNGSDCGRME